MHKNLFDFPIMRDSILKKSSKIVFFVSFIRILILCVCVFVHTDKIPVALHFAHYYRFVCLCASVCAGV